MEGKELSRYPSWSNSLWQEWSYWLVHCPGGNATGPIWRVVASSDGISSWTPLKPQHSNPNLSPLANKLWSIDFLIPPTPLIIPHRLLAFLEFLMPLKNWCLLHARWSKSSLKHSIRFCGIFPSLKQNFIAYRSSKVSSRPDYIFEIHQLWQSGFSRVCSNCCCRCSFKPEIIKIGQASHKLFSSHHHHHHVMPLARISLSFSRHFSLSFIASGRSSGLLSYLHIAAECMFELVALLLPGYIWGSIGVHHWWARPCFSSCVLYVWFVSLG